MKKLSHKLLALFLVLGSLALTAGTGRTPASGKENELKKENAQLNTNFTLTGMKHLVTAKAPFAESFSLNRGYVTGQVKPQVSTLSSILKWDLKVKFRLSSNMNIIFSYN